MLNEAREISTQLVSTSQQEASRLANLQRSFKLGLAKLTESEYPQRACLGVITLAPDLRIDNCKVQDLAHDTSIICRLHLARNGRDLAL